MRIFFLMLRLCLQKTQIQQLSELALNRRLQAVGDMNKKSCYRADLSKS